MREEIEALKVGERKVIGVGFLVVTRRPTDYLIQDMSVDRLRVVPDSRRAAVMVQMILEGDYWDDEA